MFYFATKLFWIVGLIFAGWELYGWHNQKKQVLSQRPELADSYDRVMWGYTIFHSLPWLMMGIGILSGSVASMFDFVRPRSGNLFVLAFFFVIVVSILALFVWVWAFGGAVYLSPHMMKSPTKIKLQIALVTLFLLFIIGTAFLQPTAT